ncbi:ParA family protein [Bacillus cereus]|uniref:ParA family protein n=1 Tax=Bacillus cereus TaxID=1396 RepID=UPI0018F7B071|nr:ParA family protein [Bacillus cereus]MBJ7966978.1 ParA family protein [Bacillus cereus]MBJ8003375.1 ParA family protein [Bacillus cereus]
MRAKTISILNMKGGVGKTTLSTNVAIELLNKGYKVLIIDIDPQFNSTQSLFKYFSKISTYFELRDERRTITSIFSGDKGKGISRKNDDTDNLIYTLKGNTEESDEPVLDIIPGDLKLIIDINTQAVDRLSAFFNRNNLKDQYDYIIFDCPPTWGQVTSVSLSLSNYYLIPTRLDDFSTIGITLLSQLLKEKVESLQAPLKCLGVVYTMLNETSAASGISIKQTRYKEKIEEFFGKTMINEVRSDVKAFDTVIYNYGSVASQSIVYEEYSNPKGINLYESIKELTEEILSRIESWEVAKVE